MTFPTTTAVSCWSMIIEFVRGTIWWQTFFYLFFYSIIIADTQRLKNALLVLATPPERLVFVSPASLWKLTKLTTYTAEQPLLHTSAPKPAFWSNTHDTTRECFTRTYIGHQETAFREKRETPQQQQSGGANGDRDRSTGTCGLDACLLRQQCRHDLEIHRLPLCYLYRSVPRYFDPFVCGHFIPSTHEFTDRVIRCCSTQHRLGPEAQVLT